MRTLSFLVALSASEQSRNAAELCWLLAERANAKVLAQHVIDTQAAWEIFGNDRPGFIGSGPYVAAHEQLLGLLRSLGKDLISVYDVYASGHPIESQSVMDEGNPVREICRRAADSDLVIIGHRPSMFEEPEDERRLEMRFSLAESLAHECPCPLLVTQEPCKPWSDMRIISSMDHLNEMYIRACYKLASSLSLKAELAVLATGTHEQEKGDFISDFKQANTDLSELPVYVKRISNQIFSESKSAWWAEEADLEWNALPDTLMIIPTRKFGDRRITLFGASPAFFVRHLSLPSILLWPEEYTDRFPGLPGKSEGEKVSMK